MELKELSVEQFSTFALHHDQNNFHQTLAWAYLKNRNGWQYHFVGLVDKNDNIKAASLLLSKKFIGKLNMFYAPRGFLIDYKDYELLKIFTKEIKAYAFKKGAFFIKIDPYVMYKERDIEGKLVEHGVNNSEAVKNLKRLGYRHYGFTKYQETLQPRWMFVLDVENKTSDQILNEVYHQTTRHIINKTLKLAYSLDEVNLDNMLEFKKIMEETSKRRGFIDRPLSYYQNMYEILSKYDMIKIYLVKFNCEESINILHKENKDITTKIEDLKHKFKAGYNKKVITKQIKELETNIENNKNKIDEYDNLRQDYGNIITMSGSLFITYGDEVLYLFSGTYEQFLKYNAPYRLQWEMIKYAIDNKYKRYNFYGISGTFDKKDPAYGVYLFKKGFNGHVVELIGEFDLIINKFYYYCYIFSYSLYRHLKRIVNKIKR